MSGFLLLSPTGSGKSWACKNNPFFAAFAIDGDSLINWKFNWGETDWKVKDREHLDIVLDQMRSTGKCVCWYVGTTAIADALDEGRLLSDEVGVVLLSVLEHCNLVQKRNKKGHDWATAIEHRNLCENLIRSYKLPRFSSFPEASEHVRARVRKPVESEKGPSNN
jgi:hypothetical protein